MQNYIRITKSNYEDFKEILPPAITVSPERVILGCYDDDGSVLGTMSFTMTEYEYEIDWLYVVPENRRQGTASGLMKLFFDFWKKTGEIYPVRALFEVTETDASLYWFFLSVEEMDVSFSHNRYRIDHEEIAGMKDLSHDRDNVFDEQYFFELDKKEQDAVLDEIAKDGIYVIENREDWENECILDLCRVI